VKFSVSRARKTKAHRWGKEGVADAFSQVKGGKRKKRRLPVSAIVEKKIERKGGASIHFNDGKEGGRPLLSILTSPEKNHGSVSWMGLGEKKNTCGREEKGKTLIIPQWAAGECRGRWPHRGEKEAHRPLIYFLRKKKKRRPFPHQLALDEGGRKEGACRNALFYGIAGSGREARSSSAGRERKGRVDIPSCICDRERKLNPAGRP